MIDYGNLDNYFNKIYELSICQQNSNVPEPVTPSTINYCTDCGVPMLLASSEYQCSVCGKVETNKIESTYGCDVVPSVIRISTGANKGRYYNVLTDYSRTQRKMIYGQLMNQRSNYNGDAMPVNILNATADQYNQIQKSITEDEFDDNGDVCGQKKFVRRGDIKNEVLAALIYFECIRENIVRKKKDIASFMGLSVGGFTRGENIIRNLEAEGKISIPVDGETAFAYVERYFKTLRLKNSDYRDFILELVERSEELKLGMNSQLSSKVVGAIWILITKCKLKITSAQLEKATDNTKKNTFVKFCNIVYNNIDMFIDLFEDYKIPV